MTGTAEPRFEARRGVWELVTDPGTRYLVRFDDDGWMRLPDITSECGSQLKPRDGEWQHLWKLSEVRVREPATLWAGESEAQETGRVVAWRPLPGALLLGDGRVVLHAGVLGQVHRSLACAGRPYGCWIHEPIEHPLSSAPVLWRDDKGIAERLCEHGVGHPDPQAGAYSWQHQEHDATIHGCCGYGCCGPLPDELRSWLPAPGTAP